VDLRGDVLHGRRDIGARVSAGLQGRMKGSRLSVSIRRFTLLTPDVALIETDYEYSGIRSTLPGVATTKGVLRTRMKYVAAKRDKRWYFVAGQNTPVLPPARKGQ
jgi:uncharacterized protein (TIGR02246 family)